jgi:hypothetical protein
MPLTDPEKFELARAGLRHCPECGKKVVPSSKYLNTLGCTPHGDFMLLWIEGELTVRWVSLRMMALAKPKEETTIERDRKIYEIGDRYARGEITFLEACQLIACANGQPFPAEPTFQDRCNGRAILDENLYTAPQPHPPAPTTE